MYQPNPDHATHDRTLIAGAAAGDLSPTDQRLAETLLASCAPCADLHRDLLAVAIATRSLPAPATSTRDFRLTPDQAARLRRGGWIRGFLRPFGAAGSATRPLAAAFTSLGVAGLLVATVLPGLMGGTSAGAPAGDATLGSTSENAPAATTAPAPPYATAAAAGAPSAVVPQAAGASPTDPDYRGAGRASAAPGSSTGVKAVASATNDPREVAFAGGASPAADDGSTVAGALVAPAPPNPLLLGSLVLLAVGLAMFGLRYAGRRIR